MAAERLDIDAIRARLEGVEARQRRLKHVVGVVLVFSGVLLAVDHHVSRNPAVIEARHFVLRDERAAVRAELTTTEDGGVGLGLYAKDGNSRAQLVVMGDGSASLSLRNHSGLGGIVLLVNPNGSQGISLVDKDDKMRTELALRADDVTALSLYDKNERPGIALGTGADGTSWLSLPEKADKPPAALRGAGGVATQAIRLSTNREPQGAHGRPPLSACGPQQEDGPEAER